VNLVTLCLNKNLFHSIALFLVATRNFSPCKHRKTIRLNQKMDKLRKSLSKVVLLKQKTNSSSFSAEFIGWKQPDKKHDIHFGLFSRYDPSIKLWRQPCLIRKNRLKSFLISRKKNIFRACCAFYDHYCHKNKLVLKSQLYET
jgi:hypothetical protein